MSSTSNSYTPSFEEKPEIAVVALAAKGVQFPKEDNAIRLILEGLQHGEVSVYFPFYWSQIDVRELFRSLKDILDPRLVIDYLQSIATCIIPRFPDKLHWIELCNLYHFFGLLRMYREQYKSECLNIIDNTFGYKSLDSLKSSVDLSALSARSEIENRLSQDMGFLLNLLVNDPQYLRFYGYYQVNYYGGFEQCINGLAKYFGGEKELYIPQSVLSLLEVQKDLPVNQSKQEFQILSDKLFSPLTPSTKLLLEPYCKALMKDE